MSWRLVVFLASVVWTIWGVWRLTRVHNLVVRHRADLVTYLRDTLIDLPPDLQPRLWKEAQAILDAQVAELEAERRRWW